MLVSDWLDPLENIEAVIRHYASGGVRGHLVQVLDPATEGFIVELTASEAEVNAFVADLARGAQLLEVVRSGALGISRTARSLRAAVPDKLQADSEATASVTPPSNTGA